MSPENKNHNYQPQLPGLEDAERASLLERTRALIGTIRDVSLYGYGVLKAQMEERGADFSARSVRMPESSSTFFVEGNPKIDSAKGAAKDALHNSLVTAGKYVGERYAALPKTDDAALGIEAITDRLSALRTARSTARTERLTGKREAISSSAETEAKEDQVDLMRGKDKRRRSEFPTKKEEKKAFEDKYDVYGVGAVDEHGIPKLKLSTGTYKRSHREVWRRSRAMAEDSVMADATDRLSKLESDPSASAEELAKAREEVSRIRELGPEDDTVLREAFGNMGGMIFARWAPQWAASRRKNIGSIHSGTERLREAKLQDQKQSRLMETHRQLVDEQKPSQFGGINAKQRAQSLVTPTTRHRDHSPSAKEKKRLGEEIDRMTPKNLSERFGKEGEARYQKRLSQLKSAQSAKADEAPTKEAARLGDTAPKVRTIGKIDWAEPRLTTRHEVRDTDEFEVPTEADVQRAKASGDRGEVRRIMQLRAAATGTMTRRDLLANSGVHGDLAYNETAALGEIAAKEKADLDKLQEEGLVRRTRVQQEVEERIRREDYDRAEKEGRESVIAADDER